MESRKTGSDAAVQPVPCRFPAVKRYEALAAEIAGSIRAGVFAPGARLPSVRQLSRDRGVSPSTVFEAYSRLEADGLARSKPRSGWYVAAAPSRLPPMPARTPPPDGEARPVAVSERVFASNRRSRYS